MSLRAPLLRLTSLALVMSCATPGGSDARPTRGGRGAKSSVVLDGTRMAVRWSDGDSFRFLDGPHRGMSARLKGYNTLETFGSVHRWGTWTPEDLLAIAKSCAKLAGAKVWSCRTEGQQDGYMRLLVECPDLTRELVRTGVAMVYAPEGSRPDAPALALQAEAMREKRGLWRLGAPRGVVTSVHSVGEDARTATEAYNRVVDTRTGRALVRRHTSRYAVCEEVCEDTDGDSSCMTYVPFEQRYRNKPACLRRGFREDLAADAGSVDQTQPPTQTQDDAEPEGSGAVAPPSEAVVPSAQRGDGGVSR